MYREWKIFKFLIIFFFNNIDYFEEAFFSLIPQDDLDKSSTLTIQNIDTELYFHDEDEEKEICGSSRGERQFISDLWEGVFPRDQVTTVEEKEEDVEKEFILHITSEARLSLSSTAYNT